MLAEVRVQMIVVGLMVMMVPHVCGTLSSAMVGVMS